MTAPEPPSTAAGIARSTQAGESGAGLVTAAAWRDEAVGPIESPAERRTTSDVAMVGVAVAAVVGAWAARPLPLAVGAVGVALGLLGRRALLLGVGAALLASGLGARALAGLDPGPPRSVEAVVTLVSDPDPGAFDTRADVRWDGHRYELRASGPAAGVVGAASAGERVAVAGTIRPPSAPAPWLVPRHVGALLVARRAERVDGGSWPWRGANRVRALLDRGVAVLPADTASLFRGFVLGDDRGQQPWVVDDFRATGLTHLLVVSGQNVAFVLVLVAPIARRLRLGARWAVTMAVVLAFGTVTRFEPSVLRAAAMAGLVVTATLLGRRAPPLRVLALAVTGLVLVDPLLVRSVGFQLSVGASAGIVVLARPIAARLPGPRVLAEAVGVTLAAQAGVAPVQIPQFGGIPVVSVLTNPLAVPVAGLVTTWGLVAGLAAGVLGGTAARVLHLPTQALIGWVAGVARVGARLPLGEVGWPGLLAVAGGLLLVGRGEDRARPAPTPGRDDDRLLAALGLGAARIDGGEHAGSSPGSAAGPGRLGSGPPQPAHAARARRPRRPRRSVGWGLVAVGLVTPAIGLRRPPPLRVAPASGVVVWRSGGATVVEVSGATGGADLLGALRRAGVRRIDVLLVRTRASVAAVPGASEVIGRRLPVGRLLGPEDALVAPVQVGGLRLDPSRSDPPATVSPASRSP